MSFFASVDLQFERELTKLFDPGALFADGTIQQDVGAYPRSRQQRSVRTQTLV